MFNKILDIVMTSSIPRIYQITPEPVGAPGFENFICELNETLDSGIKIVQLRAKKLSRRENLAVAELALRACRKYGALFIFNGSVEMALEARCDGVHLCSEALMACQQRPALAGFLVSAACHNEEQVAQAEKIGADFIVVSPVFATKTHPEAVPIGWQYFSELASGSRAPLFALGGMKPEMLDDAKKYGAWGIAAISSTWCSTASEE